MAPLPDTRWSVLLRSRSPEDADYEAAWEYLVDTYRGLIERYFAAHAPDGATATDWTDEFLADWVGGALDGAQRERGCFRQYLFASLRNFKNSRLRRARSAGRDRERQGGLALDLAEADEPDADSQFERDFASHVLDRALERLKRHEARHEASGNRFHTLICRYHLDEASPRYRELASQLGLTEKAVERQLAKARGKLRGWIMDDLRQTVSSESELADEVNMMLRHCRHVLGARPGAAGVA